MFRKRDYEAESFAIQQWISANSCQAELDILRAKIAELDTIIQNRGLVPRYQDFVERKHRDEWPLLWSAIDSLREEYRRSL